MEVNFNIAANVTVLEPETSFDATCCNHKQNLHNTHKVRNSLSISASVAHLENAHAPPTRAPSDIHFC